MSALTRTITIACLISIALAPAAHAQPAPVVHELPVGPTTPITTPPTQAPAAPVGPVDGAGVFTTPPPVTVPEVIYFAMPVAVTRPAPRTTPRTVRARRAAPAARVRARRAAPAARVRAARPARVKARARRA